MKNILFLFLLFATSLFSQNKTGILFNPSDSTYTIVDTIFHADGRITINQSAAIRAKEIANFLFSSALTEQARQRDLLGIQERLTDKFTFLASTIDTLLGGGSFENLATQNLQNSLGGNWLIRYKDASVDEKIKVQITGTTITQVGGMRAGTVTASGSEEITIAGFFAKSVVLILKGNNEFFFREGRKEIRMRRR